MDDQTTLKTYGNTNLIEGTEDRPLVTFALFAYNQEEYIREAIEGAFSQAYSPLEIIISDDCSSDKTFKFMNQLAADYCGPHKIIVRRTQRNLGTLGHVLDVAAIANGEIIVVAAGDDVSLSERTQLLADEMKKKSQVAISSEYIFIDENGCKAASLSKKRLGPTGETFGTRVSRIHGATAAYRRSVLVNLSVPEAPVLFEDAALEVIFHYRNFDVGFLEKDLIFHRVHSQNTSIKELDDVEEYERKFCENKFKANSAALYAACELRSCGLPGVVEDLERYAKFFSRASIWRDLSFVEKILLLTKADSWSSFRWFLPRAMLSWGTFMGVKRVVKR